MSTHTASRTPIHVVLVPGFWLGGWAWDAVLPTLLDAGLTPHPVTLPGLASPADEREHLTLDDHVTAVAALVDDLDGSVVLVGHSGGSVVVQSVLDRRPGRIARVVYIDSGPLRPGSSLAVGLPDGATEIPFPADEEMAANGQSAEGLDATALADLRGRVVPHPAGVAASPAEVSDPARFDVPVTEVCTSLPSAVLRELATGDALHTELLEYRDVTYVDLPTGHWPMFSRPADLGAVIAEAARPVPATA